MFVYTGLRPCAAAACGGKRFHLCTRAEIILRSCLEPVSHGVRHPLHGVGVAWIPERGSEGKCGGVDSVQLRRCAGRVPGRDGDDESWDLPVAAE